MKFMVFTSPTEDGINNPPTAPEYNSQIDGVRAAIVNGRVETVYHGRGRAIYVVNGASEQDVENFFASIPRAHQMKRIIEPLEDFFEHATRISAYLTAEDEKRGGDREPPPGLA
jgi:hypothetical protein